MMMMMIKFTHKLFWCGIPGKIHLVSFQEFAQYKLIYVGFFQD